MDHAVSKVIEALQHKYQEWLDGAVPAEQTHKSSNATDVQTTELTHDDVTGSGPGDTVGVRRNVG